MSKDDFIAWWLQTEHGGEQEKKIEFHWDGAGNKSEIWQHFDQVSHHTSGLPKVMCQRCGKILDHPNCTSNGTNSMRRHWKGEKCQRAASQAGRQPNIRKAIEDSV